jgi:hypothetical protein
MRAFLAAALSLPLLTLASAPSAPKSTGILPGEFGAPPNLTSALPACGNCHDPLPNANGRVTLGLEPAALSLEGGRTIAVRALVTGGPNLGLAGFCIETDRGGFLASATTRTTATGSAITHIDRFNSQWDFQYTAPGAPGLVRWTMAGQSVNADLTPAGDSFGFYGPDSSVPGVPLRLFVNAPQIVSFGGGCPGTDRHVPVLGASTTAAIGQNLDLAVVSVPPGAQVFVALGESDQVFGGLPLPFDLAILGAPGCLVRCNHRFLLASAAAGSGSGGGTVGVSLPLPNDPALRGLVLFAQALVRDAAANSAGLTASNALKATIQ